MKVAVIVGAIIINVLLWQAGQYYETINNSYWLLSILIPLSLITMLFGLWAILLIISDMDGVIIIVGTIISSALLWQAWQYYETLNNSYWFLGILIPLFLSTILFGFGLILIIVFAIVGFFAWLIHLYLLRYGIQTTATISGNTYIYHNHNDEEYKFLIECSHDPDHWPSPEEIEMRQKRYLSGTVHPVFYAKRFPFIHEVQYPD